MRTACWRASLEIRPLRAVSSEAVCRLGARGARRSRFPGAPRDLAIIRYLTVLVRADSSHIELHDLRMQPLGCHPEPPDRNRQVEAAGAGAAGVDVEHAVLARLDRGLVGVAEHDGRASRGGWPPEQ